MEEDFIVENGCNASIRFPMSNGTIFKMEPGKVYDENFNEKQPERLSERDASNSVSDSLTSMET